MPLSLSEARALLSRYAGANNIFTDRINLVCERLLKSGNWKLTKNRVVFNVFPDANNAAFITLPRIFNTILAGAVLQPCGTNSATWGYPLPIRNGWYSYSLTGTGLQLDSRYNWREGFDPEEGWFTTFANWTTAKMLRFKFETTENAGNIIVKGTLNGSVIRSGVGAANIEGITVPYTGADVTTTQTFDASPYQIVKPITHGRVGMFIWDGTTEVPVAVYDPTETNPGWRRYRVPACSTWNVSAPGQFVTICKRAYAPVSNDNDEIVPSNIGALRFGLEALTVEDSRSMVEAETLWNAAMNLLAKESDDDTGAAAENVVQVADDFAMAGVGGLT